MSGLHAKLDRKKAIDQYNTEAQSSFTHRMNALFRKMQTSINENYWKQQQMLDNYTCSVGECFCSTFYVEQPGIKKLLFLSHPSPQTKGGIAGSFIPDIISVQLSSRHGSSKNWFHFFY